MLKLDSGNLRNRSKRSFRIVPLERMEKCAATPEPSNSPSRRLRKRSIFATNGVGSPPANLISTLSDPWSRAECARSAATFSMTSSSIESAVFSPTKQYPHLRVQLFVMWSQTEKFFGAGAGRGGG